MPAVIDYATLTWEEYDAMVGEQWDTLVCDLSDAPIKSGLCAKLRIGQAVNASMRVMSCAPSVMSSRNDYVAQVAADLGGPVPQNPAGIPSTPAPPATSDPIAAGFTDYTVIHPDAKIIYWAPETGLDTNDGLTVLTPVKTYAKAKSLCVNFRGDHIEMFEETASVSSGVLMTPLSGKNETYPFVIKPVSGASTMPVIDLTGISTALRWAGGSDVAASGDQLTDFAMVGIEILSSSRAKGDVPTPINITAGKNKKLRNIRFEGLKIHDTHGVLVQNSDLTDGGVVLFRCNIYETFSTWTADGTGRRHAGGLYMNRIKDALLDECIFDMCGWSDQSANLDLGAAATIFNHSIYINLSNPNFTARRCVFSRSSSEGFKSRSGGVCEDNLFVDNPLAITMGKDEKYLSGDPGPWSGRISNNCILGYQDLQGWNYGDAPDRVRGSQILGRKAAGIGAIASSASYDSTMATVLIENNILSDHGTADLTNKAIIYIGGVPATGRVTIRNTKARNWPINAGSDPYRNAASYPPLGVVEESGREVTTGDVIRSQVIGGTFFDDNRAYGYFNWPTSNVATSVYNDALTLINA